MGLQNSYAQNKTILETCSNQVTKDLLEAVLNNEEGCLDCAEENYLQTNECDKHNTKLKYDCKEMYSELIDLMINKQWHGDLKT